MKRIIFLLFILLISIIALIEFGNILGFDNYHPRLEAAVVDNGYVLSWPKLPYWGYYEVEVLTAPPPSGLLPASVADHILVYRTWDTQMLIDQTYPSRTYWRVSAHGLFRHPFGTYSEPLNLATVMGYPSDDIQNIKPLVTSAYPAATPASNKPVLKWNMVPGAVSYEIEILSSPPENPNSVTPSCYRIAATQEVYTNGFNADLSNRTNPWVYWRVRALDYYGKPLSVYSDAQKIFIDHNRHPPLKPCITTVFNENGMATPLFPVYSWIPIVGASSYEVEILSQPPENPNGITPSIYQVSRKEAVGFDCYDDEPRNVPGIYFWRVRGLDQDGRPVGVSRHRSICC